jgi:hypothetical protein
MKCFCVTIVVITIVVGQAAASARRPAQRVVHSTSGAAAQSPSGLVVVPFAVPVAVPVSVISQPAVFYSYREYATPNAGLSDTDTPPTSTSDSATTVPLAPSADRAVALLTSRCAKCHTGVSPPGHLQIFDVAGQIVPKLPRRAILEMVSPDATGAQRMPPKDLPKLTAEELATLGEWARPPRDLKY